MDSKDQESQDIRVVTVATRPSKLASTQTEQTVELLRKANPDITFIVKQFSTNGDRDHKTSLTAFGGTGVFVKELENALIDGEADIAIHSLKDVPNNQPEELMLAAFPKRESPIDLLLTRESHTLDTLPVGSVVGTGSPRRRLQLSRLRPDVKFKEIRGNVETRIKKMESGEFDAILLAEAGLNRLGITYKNSIKLPVNIFTPAISQGIIAIECRKDNSGIRDIISKISDTETVIAMLTERAFMKEIEGGCKFPLAAYALANDQTKRVAFKAIVGDTDTGEYIEQSLSFGFQEVLFEPVQIAQRMRAEAERRGYNLTQS